MAKFIQEIGKTIKWTERAKSYGQMGQFTKVPMLMIKNMDMVNLFGRMDKNIEEIGKTVNRMEKGLL